MTLKGVPPVTGFFSDRPDGIVGHVRNDIFLRQWSEGKNSLKSDPPNAVLSIFNEGTRPSDAIVGPTAVTFSMMHGHCKAISQQPRPRAHCSSMAEALRVIHSLIPEILAIPVGR